MNNALIIDQAIRNLVQSGSPEAQFFRVPQYIDPSLDAIWLTATELADWLKQKAGKTVIELQRRPEDSELPFSAGYFRVVASEQGSRSSLTASERVIYPCLSPATLHALLTSPVNWFEF